MDASSVGGTNYAFGLAQTTDGITSAVVNGAGAKVRVTNLGQQVADYLASHRLDRKALHVLWAGSNDLFNDAGKARAAAENVAQALTLLEQVGARRFLVLNLPPLGHLPAYQADPQQAAVLNQATGTFNAHLAAALDLAESEFPSQDGAMVYRLNVNALFRGFTANPAKAGLRNVTAPCQGKRVNPDRWLFGMTFTPPPPGIIYWR